MFSIFVVEDNDAVIGSCTLCNNLFPFTVCMAVATSLCFLPVGEHLKNTHDNHDLQFIDQSEILHDLSANYSSIAVLICFWVTGCTVCATKFTYCHHWAHCALGVGGSIVAQQHPFLCLTPQIA